MTGIAFFGHDSGDAAIRRRVQSFRDDGMDVVGFMMRRTEANPTEWDNVDLGLTKDEAYVHRLKAVARGARLAAKRADLLRSADVLYARNLDMLACAFLAMRGTRIHRPVIYECLDVNRLLVRQDLVGSALRGAERRLLNRSQLLVVSSPGFLDHYFDVHHRFSYRPYILENRMAHGGAYGQRPTPTVSAIGDPLRLGWFGVLRCQRSFDLIMGLADRFGDRLQVELHGQPVEVEVKDFGTEVAKRTNVHFGGRYRSPEDLSRLYEAVDLVWAGDFMDAGFNSEWLLPNRLYEGGYYLTPSVAPATTQTATWIEERDCGFTVAEPLEEALAELVIELLADRSPIQHAQRALAELDDETFIQRGGEMSAVVRSALSSEPAVAGVRPE